MSRSDQEILEALQKFAASVTAKIRALAAGEPEDQLRAPLESLLAEVGRALGNKYVLAKGESQLQGRLGRPDYAVLVNKLLAGYIELKGPGKGASPDHYKGHDREQWKRFKGVPNLIYTDGNEWGLYRDGKRVGQLVGLSGDIATSGKLAVKAKDVDGLKPLLVDFLSWQPMVPKDAKALAELLAPLCRMLRQEVNDALKDASSPLVQLAKDWRQLLFPDADDDRFADAYAQTVTFALLLARSEGATTIDDDLHDAIQKLVADHALLSRALQVLTDPAVRDEIVSSLRLLQRVINQVLPTTLGKTNQSDPWLYFYEDFLAAYDPKMRKDAGVYYTPVEVVQAQVRLIDRLLVDKLQKPMGFGESSVITLDPAVGTGTYLLGVIDHVMKCVGNLQGQGAVPGQVTELGRKMFGFEIMVGPYAVAELRVSRALLDCGASLPKNGPGIYLTDTLESPHAQPPQTGLFYQPLADQHKRALRVKDKAPVLVCLGNPPYDRHEAADAKDAASRARTGGWVRWSDDGNAAAAIFGAFLQPALGAGHGGDVKSLYNQYVYFWRWALWKVFEHTSAGGAGVVSFISASSYLDGDAFVGMRQHMRRLCDEVWILDLGGEGRGGRQSENVFSIRTPVAIAIAACYGRPKEGAPARVNYARIIGTRDQKLAKLDSVTAFGDLVWQRCPDAWHAPFRPALKSSYTDFVRIGDLLPWTSTGSQTKRNWPVAPDRQTLEQRWTRLLDATDRASAFAETRDRKIRKTYSPLPPATKRDSSIGRVPKGTQVPRCERFTFRSFDRQFILADTRLCDFLRPSLWLSYSDKQVYLMTSFARPPGSGPCITGSAYVPDLNCYHGSSSNILPLYRDAGARHANIVPGLLDCLRQAYSRKVTAEDLASYVYGVLAQPAFTTRFHKELESRELRVPVTKDADLFEQVTRVGRRLLGLHTYGQRFTDQNQHKGRVPRGAAMCTRPVSDKPEDYPDSFEYERHRKRLVVGTGTFEPVEPEVYDFEVSGLKVVQSWFGYRMRSGRGKKSSPLDKIRPRRWTAQFTNEALELLWVLEATLAAYPEQSALLDAVLEGELFSADELPEVPRGARDAPNATEAQLLEMGVESS